MPIKNAKFKPTASSDVEDVIVNLPLRVQSKRTVWTGQMRLVRGGNLAGTETGELFLEDGSGATIQLIGVTEDASISQALYKFLITSPFLAPN